MPISISLQGAPTSAVTYATYAAGGSGPIALSADAVYDDSYISLIQAGAGGAINLSLQGAPSHQSYATYAAGGSGPIALSADAIYDDSYISLIQAGAGGAINLSLQGAPSIESSNTYAAGGSGPIALTSSRFVSLLDDEFPQGSGSGNGATTSQIWSIG